MRTRPMTTVRFLVRYRIVSLCFGIFLVYININKIYPYLIDAYSVGDNE
jgi:hypothetical protein